MWFNSFHFSGEEFSSSILDMQHPLQAEPTKFSKAPKTSSRQPLPQLRHHLPHQGDKNSNGQETFSNISNSSFREILTHNNQKN